MACPLVRPGGVSGGDTSRAGNCLMAAAAATSSQTERRHTVLVVEDEVLVRLSMADHLRECGYVVLEAASAEEAVTVLEAEIEVDVLFTDVQLPGDLDGFGLAQWTRGHRPRTRIILTSGLDRAAHAASDLCSEVPYLRKPYDPERLAREIRRLVEGAGAAG